MMRYALCLICLLIACIPAQADAYVGIFGVGYWYPTDPAGGGGNYYNLGWEFEVTQALTVIGLGSFANFSSDQQVGLWEEREEGPLLIASAFVSTTDPLLMNQWHFQDIAPVALTVGSKYVVGTQGNRSGTFVASGYAANPGFSLLSNRFATVGSSGNDPLVYPASSNSEPYLASGYFGGNILYELGSPVPEPSTLLLIAGGLLLAGVRRRHAAGDGSPRPPKHRLHL